MVWITLARLMPTKAVLHGNGSFTEIDFIRNIQSTPVKKRPKLRAVGTSPSDAEIDAGSWDLGRVPLCPEHKFRDSSQVTQSQLTETSISSPSIARTPSSSERSVRFCLEDQAGGRKLSRFSSSFKRAGRNEVRGLGCAHEGGGGGAHVSNATQCGGGSEVEEIVEKQPSKLARLKALRDSFRESRDAVLEPVLKTNTKPSNEVDKKVLNRTKFAKSKPMIKHLSPSHLRKKKIEKSKTIQSKLLFESKHPNTPLGFKRSESRSKATFEGIEDHILNAGASPRSLEKFIEICSDSSAIAVTAVFSDSHFSTSFVPCTSKFCTPKGEPCTRWWCTCAKQSRSKLARMQTAAFLFCCQQEDKGGAAGTERLTLMIPVDPKLPFECESSLEERWGAIEQVIMRSSSNPREPKVVMFEAIRTVLPLHNRFVALDKTCLICPSIFDVQLASFQLNPTTVVEEGKCEFDEICEMFLGGRDRHKKGYTTKTPIPLDSSDEMRSLIEAMDNLSLCLDLSKVIRSRLKAHTLEDSFYQIESPVAFLLASMECRGIGFLPTRLSGMEEKLEKRMTIIADEVKGYAPDCDNFNVRSSQQIATLLFKHLGIRKPASKKGKTDHISTGAEVLESIRDAHPVVPLLLEFRKLSKLQSVYVSSLPSFAIYDSSGNARIAPMWHQQNTRTGRLSCSKPNMQQLPNRPIFDGVHPRDAFVAGKVGQALFSVDYSQIEIRILAHYTKVGGVCVRDKCNSGGIHTPNPSAPRTGPRPYRALSRFLVRRLQTHEHADHRPHLRLLRHSI